MTVRFTESTWKGLVKEMRQGEGLLDYGKINPEEFIPYLSEQAVEIYFNAMKRVKE